MVEGGVGVMGSQREKGALRSGWWVVHLIDVAHDN